MTSPQKISEFSIVLDDAAIQAGIARGRLLHGQAIQAAFAQAYRSLDSLFRLRTPKLMHAPRLRTCD
ncbi:MAG: hypothetical protein QNJ92_06640 [Alphaproteobacteria bacterium]|nr:hypothetical protein [Alphaproteobacteria bacterium]